MSAGRVRGEIVLMIPARPATTLTARVEDRRKRGSKLRLARCAPKATQSRLVSAALRVLRNLDDLRGGIAAGGRRLRSPV